MSPSGALSPTHGDSEESLPSQQEILQGLYKPQAARSLFGQSEPNLAIRMSDSNQAIRMSGQAEPIRMSASALPLPSIPTSSHNSSDTSSHSSSTISSNHSAHSGHMVPHSGHMTTFSSSTSNVFRRGSGGSGAFREVGSWRSEPSLLPPGSTGQATPNLHLQQSTAMHTGHQQTHASLNALHSTASLPIGAQINAQPMGTQFSQIGHTHNSGTGSLFKPVAQKTLSNHSREPPAVPPRNPGIHISQNPSLSLQAILNSHPGVSVDSDLSPRTDNSGNSDPSNHHSNQDRDDDSDITPTPSPPPSKTFQSISSAISEVKRNISELTAQSANITMSPRDRHGNHVNIHHGNAGDAAPSNRDDLNTPMLSVLDDSSSEEGDLNNHPNNEPDSDPYSSHIPDPVLDESMLTKEGGTPRGLHVSQISQIPGNSEDKPSFHRDFNSNKDEMFATSSPVNDNSGVIASLTQENLQKNDSLYWSSKSHDFTNGSFLDNDDHAREHAQSNLSVKQHHPNIFVGFAPPMNNNNKPPPGDQPDGSGIPIRLRLSYGNGHAMLEQEQVMYTESVKYSKFLIFCDLTLNSNTFLLHLIDIPPIQNLIELSRHSGLQSKATLLITLTSERSIIKL